jgi:uncharacterized protein
MATLELDTNSARYIIRAYQTGVINVNDHEYQESLIIMPEQLIHPWLPQTVSELNAQHLAAFLEHHPEILLIGTGETQALLPLSLYGHLINHGIGVEIMPTRSACYTYNALVAEGRRVAAALLIR